MRPRGTGGTIDTRGPSVISWHRGNDVGPWKCRQRLGKLASNALGDAGNPSACNTNR